MEYSDNNGTVKLSFNFLEDPNEIKEKFKNIVKIAFDNPNHRIIKLRGVEISDNRNNKTGVSLFYKENVVTMVAERCLDSETIYRIIEFLEMISLNRNMITCTPEGHIVTNKSECIIGTKDFRYSNNTKIFLDCLSSSVPKTIKEISKEMGYKDTSNTYRIKRILVKQGLIRRADNSSPEAFIKTEDNVIMDNKENNVHNNSAIDKIESITVQKESNCDEKDDIIGTIKKFPDATVKGIQKLFPRCYEGKIRSILMDLENDGVIEKTKNYTLYGDKKYHYKLINSNDTDINQYKPHDIGISDINIDRLKIIYDYFGTNHFSSVQLKEVDKDQRFRSNYATWLCTNRDYFNRERDTDSKKILYLYSLKNDVIEKIKTIEKSDDTKDYNRPISVGEYVKNYIILNIDNYKDIQNCNPTEESINYIAGIVSIAYKLTHEDARNKVIEIIESNYGKPI